MGHSCHFISLSVLSCKKHAHLEQHIETLVFGTENPISTLVVVTWERMDKT